MNINPPPLPRARNKRFKKALLWIGILFILVVFLFLIMLLRAKTSLSTSYYFPTQTKVIVPALMTAIDMYEVDNGHFPPSLNALWFRGSETNWNGPYVRSTNSFLDPWTNQFRYQVKGDMYELRSAGADRVFFTKDDISN